jgi:hypothetical protein
MYFFLSNFIIICFFLNLTDFQQATTGEQDIAIAANQNSETAPHATLQHPIANRTNLPHLNSINFLNQANTIHVLFAWTLCPPAPLPDKFFRKFFSPSPLASLPLVFFIFSHIYFYNTINQSMNIDVAILSIAVVWMA